MASAEEPQVLRERIRKETEKKYPDREIAAGLYIRLFELDPQGMSREERQQGGDCCRLACFAALFGTSSMEYIPVYSRYAAAIDNTGANPFLEIDCMRSEAMAAILLGKEAGAKLLRILRILRSMDISRFSRDLQRKITRNTVSILQWLARNYLNRERPERARTLGTLALNFYDRDRKKSPRKKSGNPQERQKHILFRASVLHKTGMEEEAAALVREGIPMDTGASLAVLAAEILHNSPSPSDADPYLEKAVRYYGKQHRATYEQTLTIQHILLERAIASDNREAVLEAYTRGVHHLDYRRNNFALTENQEAILGNESDFYSRMIAYSIAKNDFTRALRAVQDSYWNIPSAGGTAADPESRLLNAALSREQRLSRTDRRPDPQWGDDNQIVFHVADDHIYRLSRIDGKKQTAVIHWPKNKLQRELHGLLARISNPADNPAFFRICIDDFSGKLFQGMTDVLASQRRITITANAPLSGLPWPALSDGAHLLFRPGNSPAPTNSTYSGKGMLSLAEDGTTLPMAPVEQDSLRQQFPDGTHLTASPAMKQDFIARLSSCGQLHFAGHGYENTNNPERSGLVLRGVPPNILPDEVISIQEFRSLKLSNISLAFINSCSSGKGREYSGGVQLSVATALLESGVRELIVSCIPIRDSSSIQFTKSFYKTMLENKLSPEEAFYSIRKQNPAITAPYQFIKA